VILAHIMGIPVEESVVQLAPVGAVMATTLVIAGRTGLGPLRRRLRHPSRPAGSSGPSKTRHKGHPR
jgi:hypothetical protein